ncbi:unnamed protein product [Didymodactylos carnosus]|uniref:Integrase catalytic domain-containing protein n=1 Tax=Didymodactylos carnosus TaxID=1234261 RepID=A0A815DF16_9BILA|nr:unnamed protein product [Didymodactylos carnosus]CAF1296133.1 unnamed protein product [Didymodactylos carnosus]CAF3532905.1 unnamed protein product [Didymodactylos carnosus]CAF4110982.1 unnamed protein product [Didymodactylos carnosus]
MMYGRGTGRDVTWNAEKRLKAMTVLRPALSNLSYSSVIFSVIPGAFRPFISTTQSTHVHPMRQKFTIVKLAGIDVVYCTKSKKPICVYESLFNIIKECHDAVSHEGRDKTLTEVNSHYSWVPKIVIEIYLKTCVACQVRKPLKHPAVSKPIISLGVMTRLQIDLIDVLTRPDIVSRDIVYSWILHCIDHFSKFTFAYSLKNKLAVEVASKLRKLCFSFGPPHLLYSDNGAEFVAPVIVELTTLFPDMCFIRGRPRHPQSQGCIERANGVLSVALGKWLDTNHSTH